MFIVSFMSKKISRSLSDSFQNSGLSFVLTILAIGVICDQKDLESVPLCDSLDQVGYRKVERISQ